MVNKNLFIDFKFITSDNGYKTGLENYHDMKGWVNTGAWIDYFTKLGKCADFSKLDEDKLMFLNDRDTILNLYKDAVEVHKTSFKSGLQGFDGGRYIESVNVNELKSKIKDNKLPFYEMIISSNDEMIKSGMAGNNKWRELVEKEVLKWLESSGLGFKRENLELYYSIHGNTDNPHIHLAFFEKTNLRNLNRKVIGIQNQIASRKFEELRLGILRRFTDDFDINSIDKKISEIRELKAKFDKNLVNGPNIQKDDILFLKSECMLNKNIWYSRLSKKSKGIVANAREYLMKHNESFRDAINEYYFNYDELKKIDIKKKNLRVLYHKKIDKEKNEFERKINNLVLRELLSFKKDKSNEVNVSKNKSINLYSNSYSKMSRDDYKYLSKHTKRLLRLAYIIFDIENAKQYDNFMREM
ncbi:hypothetical protein O7983_000489 [Mycoplasmopsis felis]|uniref:hypothetical protein n=1 Tax=Mycoplasmopsis felis TaxID=33923 RepID=UPI003A4DE9D6